MKLINKNMKLQEERGLKIGECWWDEIWETGELREKPQMSQLFPPKLFPWQFFVHKIKL